MLKYRYHVLAILFIGTILLFWPGIAMHDSTWQYQQALSAQYSDHHPPLMAFLWRNLNYWHAGFGLMFLLQISLLYAGICLIMRTIDQMRLKHANFAYLLLLILPIYPQILIYELIVSKDVQLAASFLCAGGILAFYTISKKRMPLVFALVVFLLLLYGATVKYQAKFVVIIFAVWLGVLLMRSGKIWQRIFIGIAVYLAILSAICLINSSLVPTSKSSYAWQYVKLYDLAAISIDTNEDLIPSFNKTSAYTARKLEQRFVYPAIDNLVFKQEPILQITKDQSQMQQLCKIWRTEVSAHPWVYLKHRAANMRHVLLARAGYMREAQDVPIAFVDQFPSNSVVYTILDIGIGMLFYIFMSDLPVLFLGVFYLGLSLRYWHKTNAAKVLFGFSATALLMLTLLFFMSMAGTPRYAYLSVVLIHAANVFALATYYSKKK